MNSTRRKISPIASYPPKVSLLMPTLISELNNRLNVSSDSRQEESDPHSNISTPSSGNSVPPSFHSSPQCSQSHSLPISSRPLQLPTEEYFPEDGQYTSENSSKAHEYLTEQCGSGSVPRLCRSAYIRRLLPTCEVYKNILKYINNSSGNETVTVKTIYKIERFNDTASHIDESFRILLWHGTSPCSVPGIIESGFRTGKGGMFGGGIYFADRVAKSLIYTTKNKENNSTFLVLVEVFPGKMYKAHHFHTSYERPPNGYDSVKGNGAEIPNWKENKDYFGAVFPSGPTVKNSRHPSYDMRHNEYIVYDMNRVIIRFVVECTF